MFVVHFVPTTKVYTLNKISLIELRLFLLIAVRDAIGKFPTNKLFNITNILVIGIKILW